MRKGRMPRVAVAVGALLVALACASVARGAFTPGSPGLGDPFFPLAGNGGYDVSHYSLTLDYTPSTNRLVGTDVITATATQDLSRFDLDLRGFSITQLLVNGEAATFSRDGQELVITPRTGIRSGTTFTVTVGYAGTPTVVTDPDQSIEGWVPTADGAFVVGEPQGSPGWYAVNDSPRDKATFDFAVTVPAGLTVDGERRAALARTRPAARRPGSGARAIRWRRTSRRRRSAASTSPCRASTAIPSYVAVDPTLSNGNVLRKLPAIVDFYASIYGPYPFDAVGAIVDDAKVVGYSLETQTKPVFDRMPDEATLAHELSHMWFGDSVTLTTWPDIWLHEGFATWSEWIWSEYQGNKSAAQWFNELYNTPAQDTALLDAAARQSRARRRSCSTGRSTTAAA